MIQSTCRSVNSIDKKKTNKSSKIQLSVKFQLNRLQHLTISLFFSSGGNTSLTVRSTNTPPINRWHFLSPSTAFSASMTSLNVEKWIEKMNLTSDNTRNTCSTCFNKISYPCSLASLSSSTIRDPSVLCSCLSWLNPEIICSWVICCFLELVLDAVDISKLNEKN